MSSDAVVERPRWKSRLPRKMAPVKTLDDIRAKCLETASGCWEWQGGRHEAGYGRTQHNDRVRPSHRVALELSGVDVAPSDHIDHLCRNPACCNPKHLEAVTCRVNIQRGRATKNLLPDGSFRCHRCGSTKWHRQVDETAAEGWLRRCSACRKRGKRNG